MKRKLWSIIVLLALMLALAIPAQAAQLDNITDSAMLLDESQWQQLEQQAREISQQYGVGVYVITVDDYRNYTNGDIYNAADAFYFDYDLGLGDDRDGILLLLSMAERDYLLIAYGGQAKYAFNESGREKLVDYFLDDFGSDYWYEGFADYLTWSEDYLAQAKNGTPYSAGNLPMSAEERDQAISIRVAAIFLVPLLIAGVYVAILNGKMKSVAAAEEAYSYRSGNLQLYREHDHFAYTTTVRRKIEKESSSRSSSGGGSGTSGKF